VLDDKIAQAASSHDAHPPIRFQLKVTHATNMVLPGRSVLQDFADKHGGNLREALEQDCSKIKAALSK
jgi:hypothetical protein